MANMAVMLAGGIALASVMAATAEDQYQGVMRDENRMVPIILALPAKPELGTTAGRIRFRGAWVCDFPLEYGGVDGKVSTYFFAGAGPGRCGALTSGHLESRQGDDGLVVQLFNKTGSPQFSSFTLSRP